MNRPAALALALCSGCMSYAPPIRGPGYGAPGRLRQGQLEFGAGAGGPAAPEVGSPWIAYAVRDWANVEVGATVARKQFAMGFLGGRFTYAPKRERKLHGALDGELGVGVGAGGNLDCPGLEPCRGDLPWQRRLALGGYAGGGAGYHFHFFALYTRGRIQASVAEGLPPTLWGSAHGGLQFRIARLVDLFGSAGLTGLSTAAGSTFGFTYDFGLSFYFDVRRANRPAR